MPIYSYQSPSAINAITFKKTEGGHRYAYLSANSSIPASKLHEVMCAANDQGWQVTPSSISGKPVLQIQGFNQDLEVLMLLQNHQLISGPAHVSDETKDESSFINKVRKRSLGASGLAYLLGDASFAAYGYKGGDGLNLTAGLLYGAGTASLLGFGRKDQSDLQVKEISQKLTNYLKEHGHALPENCSIDSIIHDKNKGLIKSADDVLRRYPSELMNLFFAAAGIFIAAAAHRSMKKPPNVKYVAEVLERNLPSLQKQAAETGKALSTLTNEFEHSVHVNHKREAMLDIGLGGMTAASGLFAMSVKEKAHDPDAPPKEGLAKLWEKIQEKPLTIAGIGYMISTACHAVSTKIAWKYADDHKRKSVKYRASFIFFNVIAELLLAISSKGHGDGVKSDKSVDDTVISLAADLVVKQPRAMQAALVDYIAGFLGKPEVLGLKNDEAKEKLAAAVELMRGNPWALATQAGVNQTPQQQVMPALAQASNAPATAQWQTHVTPKHPTASTNDFLTRLTHQQQNEAGEVALLR